MPSAEEHQRAAASIILKSIGGDGFALAGSGAIREHGILHRATQDIDLFTIADAAGQFATAVAKTVESLTQHGYLPLLSRSADQFARLAVTSSDGYMFEVDLGVDWRAHDPVHLSIGPVLALQDAVANKVCALYGRAAARDFLDVDAIRTSGRFTDAELLRLAIEHDPGFDQQLFASQLAQVSGLRLAAVDEYGVTAEQFTLIQQRLLGWQQQIVQLDAE